MEAAADRPEYLTTREVAALLRVKERKVYELAGSGAIPCRRVTGKLLFPRADIEAWLAAGAPATPMLRATEGGTETARANVVVGSHDPLLEWALREAGSGLAVYFDGSLDGLDRLGRGMGVAAGLHIFEPECGGWNVDHVRQLFSAAPFVLIEWAKRRQGLILAADGAATIGGIGDLRGRRVLLRQPTAGARILFDHLLVEAGMAPDDLTIVPGAARTESDAAAAIAAGQADATIGLEGMARQFRLAFVPLVEERYDLLIERRAYFEPPLQALLAFCRTPAFAAKAKEIGGYDTGAAGTVHWNGP